MKGRPGEGAWGLGLRLFVFTPGSFFAFLCVLCASAVNVFVFEGKHMQGVYSYSNSHWLIAQEKERKALMQSVVRQGSEIVPVPVVWLWPGVIPIGKVSMLIGDPGLGKSYLTTHLAALLSTRLAFPGHPESARPNPAQTLFMSAEDDPADTIVPRLLAHGADLAHVSFLEGVRHKNGDEGAIDLDKSIGALDHALSAMSNPRLVVVDPISAYLGDADSNNNSQVRGLLKHVAALAAKHDCAVLLVSHLRKEGTERAVYRATGSLAFAAAARSVWLVAKDNASGGDEDNRLLLPVKNNLCGPQKGYQFRVVSNTVVFSEERVGIDADRALSGKDDEKSQTEDKGEVYRRFLTERLGKSPGPVPVEELQRDAEAIGLNWAGIRGSTIPRDMGIVKGRVGSAYFWQLP